MSEASSHTLDGDYWTRIDATVRACLDGAKQASKCQRFEATADSIYNPDGITNIAYLERLIETVFQKVRDLGVEQNDIDTAATRKDPRLNIFGPDKIKSPHFADHVGFWLACVAEECAEIASAAMNGDWVELGVEAGDLEAVMRRLRKAMAEAPANQRFATARP